MVHFPKTWVGTGTREQRRPVLLPGELSGSRGLSGNQKAGGFLHLVGSSQEQLSIFVENIYFLLEFQNLGVMRTL